ncbi:exonuclease SbcCD subunit D [Candidatus Chlorohelix sp.]|uniref:metallophosphoesterase family protein n=1 Tax=Candidatus Chlorohelix sp. TaxID=3139201 RepID=UPI00301FE668
MRLLHIADIHFGIETYSRVDPQTGYPTRLLDFMYAFDRAIETAMEMGVDAVLFAGDAYKSRDPNPTVQREFAQRIQRLASNGIPVYLLTGNHDLPSISNRAHAIEIFQTLHVPNVYVAREIGLTLIKTKSGPLQVVALPWVTRAGLIAKEEYRGKAMEELNELMTVRITNALNAFITKLDPQIPAVLAAHATIAGSVFGLERSIMLGQDLVIQKSMLSASRFDYVAVGHIHKHQHYEVDGVSIVYPGSIERIDFGEEKEDKGFVIVDINDQGGGRASRNTTWAFHADHQTRPFRTLELDIKQVESDGLVTPTTAIIQALQREASKWENGLNEAIVRLKIKLRPEQEGQVREDEIRRVLHEMKVYLVAAISREVDKPRRTRLAGLEVEELTPLQLLEKYLQSKQVDSRRIEILLKHARDIINPIGSQ